MKASPRFASSTAHLMIATAMPVMIVAATPTLARDVPTFVEVTDSVGSANPAFRRHFWRGQLNHGTSNADTIYDAATGNYFDADG